MDSRRLARVWVAFFAVVAATTAAVWWLISLQAFDEPAGTVTLDASPGEVVHLGQGTPDRRVTIVAEQAVVHGVGALDVELRVCEVAVDGGVGVRRGPDALDGVCDRLRPAQGASIDASDGPEAGTEELVATLVADDRLGAPAGVAVFCGHEVTYRAGLRQRTQRGVGTHRAALDTSDRARPLDDDVDRALSRCP